MNVFVQVSSDCWYFFGFEDNRLLLYSSNDEFVDYISTRSNVDKAGFGEFSFMAADLPDVLKFVDRFRNDYLGITDPYEIDMPSEDVTEQLDFLDIPVDNTEDGDVLPMEIEDNVEESMSEPEPAPEEKRESKPQTEEDLLNPQEEEEKPAKKQEPEEDDDEGF